MAYAQTLSLNTKFNSSELIRVEVDTARGFHSFNLVGMAHKSVSEAKDRVASAVKNCDYVSPKQRNQKIVVSLAPAHIKKEGTHFDLAIALGYLMATKEIPATKLKGVIFVGELGLNGEIRPIKHILSVMKFADDRSMTTVIPRANAEEAKIIDSKNVFVADHIMEIINWSKGKYQLKKLADSHNTANEEEVEVVYGNRSHHDHDSELDVILGNNGAKIAIALSVIGNHHIFMYGPAGSGKTSLANWLHLLMPPLSIIEQLEVSDIRSHFMENNSGDSARAFRAPQHNISISKFIGGGNPVRAGEITLAHKGILFMDEFVEFSQHVINCLREPIQNKTVNVHTGSKMVCLPAEFTLVCATNLCHCGNFGSNIKKCHCDERQRRKYFDKLPGPIVDRIPIWALVDDSGRNTGFIGKKNITLADLQYLINKALEFKTNRLINAAKGDNGSALSNFDSGVRNFFEVKGGELGLSRRQFTNYAELARSLADMHGEYVVNREHIMQALQYLPNISEINSNGGGITEI